MAAIRTRICHTDNSSAFAGKIIMTRYLNRHHGKRLKHTIGLALFGGFVTFATSARCEDAFYHQLLKARDTTGYQPTRSFTLVTDAEHGNQMVAEDEPNLRFNLLWMEQYQPGYRARAGGAALGQIVRGYLRSAYKSYRAQNAQALSGLPDENGLLRTHPASELDYHINWDGGDFKVGVEYNF